MVTVDECSFEVAGVASASCAGGSGCGSLAGSGTEEVVNVIPASVDFSAGMDVRLNHPPSHPDHVEGR